MSLTPEQMTERLADTWDTIIEDLPSYDFSGIRQVFVDTIHPYSPAVYYDGIIVVDPSVFKLVTYTSYYTGAHTTQPLRFLLLHEICHYLQATGQVTPQRDIETQADNFAKENVCK